jgi:hypothetical protein
VGEGVCGVGEGVCGVGEGKRDKCFKRSRWLKHEAKAAGNKQTKAA